MKDENFSKILVLLKKVIKQWYFYFYFKISFLLKKFFNIFHLNIIDIIIFT